MRYLTDIRQMFRYFLKVMWPQEYERIQKTIKNQDIHIA